MNKILIISLLLNELVNSLSSNVNNFTKLNIPNSPYYVQKMSNGFTTKSPINRDFRLFEEITDSSTKSSFSNFRKPGKIKKSIFPHLRRFDKNAILESKIPILESKIAFPNTDYSSQSPNFRQSDNENVDEEDVFEPLITFPTTRRKSKKHSTTGYVDGEIDITTRRFRPKTSTQSIIDNENEDRTTHRRSSHKTTQGLIENEEEEVRTTHRRSIHKTTQSFSQIDNEAVATKSRNHRKTTTLEPFIIDNEAFETTRGKTKFTTMDSTTISPSTTQQPSSSTTLAHQTKVDIIVDGEAIAPKPQFPPTLSPTFQPYFPPETTRSFNPWEFFTTFPPSFIFSTTTIRPNLIDYAPNCLNNVALCREGGNYEKFMRTYCRETCRLYDNTNSRQEIPTQEICKDIADNCVSLQQNCVDTTSPYYLLLKRNCRKTCQLCQTQSVPSPPKTIDSNFPAPQPTTFQPFIPPFLNLPSSLSPSSPFQPFGQSPRIGPPIEPQIPIPSPFQTGYDGECRDVGQNCQQFEADCNKASMVAVLQHYCAATCNFCTSCQDSLVGQCPDFIRKEFCESPAFRLEIKKRYCKKSCNLCEPITRVHSDFSSQIQNFG